MFNLNKKKILSSQEIGVILPSLHRLSSAIVVGSRAKKITINVPKTKAIERILDVFCRNGRIRGYCYIDSSRIEVSLGYFRNMPLIRHIDIFKTCAYSRHMSVSDLSHYSTRFEVTSPSKLLLLTTNVGIVTHWEAMWHKEGGIALLELR